MTVRGDSSDIHTKPTTADAAGTCHHRDWSILPDLPLYAIATELMTPADHSSFARACGPWRSASVAARGAFMSSQPPWLCGVEYDRLYALGSGSDGSSSRFYCRKRQQQDGCEAAAEEKRWAVGFSAGYLVLAHSGSLHRLSLADPFTGAVGHRFPDAPRAFSRALLVRSSSDSDATIPNVSPPPPPILVVFNSEEIQYIRPGDHVPGWRTYRFRDDVGPVRNMAAHRGTLYAITWEGKLAAASGSDLASSTPGALSLDLVDGAECLPFGRFQGTWLGSTSTDLVAISCCYHLDPPRSVESFTVRRFQFGTGRWEKVRGLGGKALFVDMSWGVLCDDRPSRWGGQGDSVYFTDPMSNRVGVFSIKDGGTRDLGPEQPEDKFRWDLAVWVIPDLCCCE